MALAGIYPGTFDPVHEGHVAFCLAAIEQTGLERVILLPERQPRGKSRVTDFADRVTMLKLATQEYPQLEVAELDDAQFTVERTLPELKLRFGDKLALLIGSDVARALSYDRWPGLAALLKEVELIVALRQGDSREEIEALLGRFAPARFRCLSAARPEAASSAVRLRGYPDHLDASVRQYIAANKLYAK